MNKQYIKIHDGLYLDLNKAGEKAGHKYYKRVPKPTGKGYNYFYTRQQFKDYKEKGIVPGEKKGGILSGIMAFFGFKDEAKAQAKVKQVYESNKKDLSGVTVKTFGDHMNEYLGNKAKWDAKFSAKPGEKKEAGPKTDKPKSEKDKSGVMSGSGQKWDISLMKKIAGFVGEGKKSDSEKPSAEGESEFGNIHKPRELTDKQIENAIKEASKMTMKQLRRNQDIMDKQMEIANEQNKSDDIYESLEVRREIYSAAVAVKEFKDNPKEWIGTIRNISKRYEEYENEKKGKSADNFETMPESVNFKLHTGSRSGTDKQGNPFYLDITEGPLKGYTVHIDHGKGKPTANIHLQTPDKKTGISLGATKKTPGGFTPESVEDAAKEIKKYIKDNFETMPEGEKGFEKTKDEPGNEVWKIEKNGEKYSVNKTDKGWRVSGGKIKDGNKPVSLFGLKFAGSPEQALKAHIDSVEVDNSLVEEMRSPNDKSPVMSGDSGATNVEKSTSKLVASDEPGVFFLTIGGDVAKDENGKSAKIEKTRRGYNFRDGETLFMDRTMKEVIDHFSKKQSDKSAVMSGEEKKNPLTSSTSQDKMNENFKKKIAEYAPALRDVSYDEFATKHRDISSAVGNLLGKKYGDGTLILDYWKNADVKSIETRGGRKVAILGNGEQKYIQPKEVLPIIEFNLKNQSDKREIVSSGDKNKSKNTIPKEFDQFVKIAKKHDDPKKSFEIVRKIKGVSDEVAKMFRDQYGSGSKTPQEAWANFVKDAKSKPLAKASSIGPKIESEHKGTVDFITKYVKDHGTMPKATEVYRLIAKDHEDEIKDYYTRLVELEKQASVKRPKIEMDVIRFLIDNPNPSDDKVHAFAEKMNINPHDLEKVFYKLATSTARMEKDSLTKAADALFEELEKAKEMPVGTVSKGYKKVGKGKWVKVGKGGKEKKPEEKKPEKKPGKDEKKPAEKSGLSEEQRGTIKGALKKVANILAEALSGRGPVGPAGEAVEQTGENIKGMAKKNIKPEAEKPKKQEGNKK